MIVIEDRLKELFDTLPALVNSAGTFNPKFSFGDQKELNAYLKAHSRGSSVYPLIWMVYPNIEKFRNTDRVVNSDITLILATMNDQTEWLNGQRFIETFGKELFPVLGNIKIALRESGITKVISDSDGDDFTITKFPNYGDTKPNSDKHYTTDVWDAIKVEFKLEVNDCKLGIINY